MVRKGVVIAVNGDMAQIETDCTSDCSGCKCADSCIARGEGRTVIEAQNTVDAKVGDTVFAECSDKTSLAVSFVTLVLPLIIAMAALILVWNVSRPAGICISCAAFFLCFAVLRFTLERYAKKRPVYKIINKKSDL